MIRILGHWLDELLAVGFFGVLLLLSNVRDAPLFEPIVRSGLSKKTLLGLPVLLILLAALRALHYKVPNVKRILFEFAPLVLALLAYESLKHMHATAITVWLDILPKDPLMLRIDERIFGQTPYLWFDQWGLDTPIFTFTMTFFYSLYYVLPISVLGWFMLNGDMDYFRLVRRGVVIALYGGYCFYVLVPVAGPLSLFSQVDPLPLESVKSYQYIMKNFRYSFDCFPSLHTAVPWLLVMLCRNRIPALLFALLIAISIGITLSTIALRFHYGIDVIAGVGWAALVATVARATIVAPASSGKQ